MSVWGNVRQDNPFHYVKLCNPTPDGCDVQHTRPHDPDQNGKQPINGSWRITLSRPEGNAGILVGKDYGIFAFDVDDGEQAAIYESLGLPETRTHATGRGHHYFFKWVPGLPGKYQEVLMRGGKGGQAYLVAPGSVHYSGSIYTVAKDLPIAELPQNVLTMLRQQPKEFFRSEVGLVKDGEKHDALVSMNGTLRMRGVSTEARVAMLKAWAEHDFETVPSE